MPQTRMVLRLPPAPLPGASCDIYFWPTTRIGQSYICPPERTCMNGCCEFRDGMWDYGGQGGIDYCPQTGEPLEEMC